MNYCPHDIIRIVEPFSASPVRLGRVRRSSILMANHDNYHSLSDANDLLFHVMVSATHMIGSISAYTIAFTNQPYANAKFAVSPALA